MEPSAPKRWARDETEDGSQRTMTRIDENLDRLDRCFLCSLDSVRGVTFTSSLTIGRHLDNDLVIDHPMVSSWHAVIEWDGDRWRIGDLGSSNGTSVNDKRVRGRKAIKAGDVVLFAGVSRWKVEILVDPTGGASFGVTQRAAERPWDTDYHIHLTFDGPDSGIIRLVHARGEWTVTTGQRFLLLHVLCTAGGEWVDDEEFKVRLWGRQGATQVDPSALHKLIHDTRQLLLSQELDGWLIEKARGRTRLNLPADHMHLTEPA